MNTILEIALSNIVVAAGLAFVALLITRWWKNPHVAHLMWLLVLAKLVTPPLWQVPLPVAPVHEFCHLAGRISPLYPSAHDHGNWWISQCPTNPNSARLRARRFPALRLSLTESKIFCAYSGLGRSFIYEAIRSGELEARKAGRRTLILATEGERYLRSLPAIGTAT